MDEQERNRNRLAAMLTDTATRGVVAGGLGMPVDLLAQILALGGYKNPQPVGGSEWIGNQMQRGGFIGGHRDMDAESLLSTAATLPFGTKGRR